MFKKKEHIKEKKFTNIPNILVISFQRIDFNNNTKNDCYIEFEENLNLDEFINKECYEGDKSVYNLTAIVNHFGTIQTGHYYCYIKLYKTNLWYEFNDDKFNLIGEKILNKGNAYSLFYNKKIILYNYIL